MTYIDGYVLAVPTDTADAYARHATAFAEMLRQEGALQVIEAWADDVPHREGADFYSAVKAREDERLVFAFVIWPSRDARDEGTRRVRLRPEFREAARHVPVDLKRMLFGGFEAFVET